MQIHANKNEEYYLVFGMEIGGVLVTGKSPVDDAYYKDGAGSWTALTITDEATEIGTTGLYAITLSATEMNHDNIVIKFTETGVDDLVVTLNMVSSKVTLADGVSHGGTPGASTATLGLQVLNVTNSAEAVTITSTSGVGLGIQGGGSSPGISVEGGNTGGDGITLLGKSAGHGLSSQGGATGAGIKSQGGATAGHGIWAVGQATTGSGATFEATGGNGNGLKLLSPACTVIFSRAAP